MHKIDNIIMFKTTKSVYDGSGHLRARRTTAAARPAPAALFLLASLDPLRYWGRRGKKKAALCRGHCGVRVTDWDSCVRIASCGITHHTQLVHKGRSFIRPGDRSGVKDSSWLWPPWAPRGRSSGRSLRYTAFSRSTRLFSPPSTP